MTRGLPSPRGTIRRYAGGMHAAILAAALWLIPGAYAAPTSEPPMPAAAPATPTVITPDQVKEAVATGVRVIVDIQEGDPNAKPDTKSVRAEWPYEGVYRVRGEIPIGYRVGGTAIAAGALMAAPGFAEDAPRREAVERARAFVCEAINHPLMSVKDYDAGYDVRGWGYTYGAQFLMDLKRRGLVPEGQGPAVEAAIAFYLDGIEKTQIPGVGGWNYARPQGREREANPSSFMTASTVQTLLDARDAGYAINLDTLNRALDVLERCHYPSGAVAYAGPVKPDSKGSRGDATPGAVGRMCIVEATLIKAGRGTQRDLRGAIDAFFTHWEWLEARRQKTGTHVPPFNVAPYYFMFAHRYAAQGIELLPPSERAEYRRKFLLTLWRSREADGSWNDRVFRRSAAYGTAMAVLAMLEPGVEAPVRPGAQTPAPVSK